MRNEESGSLVVNGTPMEVEVGHTIQEWKDNYDDGNNWDVSLEDIITGAIEPSPNVIYWLIDGRLYETNSADW